MHCSPAVEGWETGRSLEGALKVAHENEPPLCLVVTVGDIGAPT